MLSLDNEILEEFISAKEAAKFLSRNGYTTVTNNKVLIGMASHILKVCNEKRKSANGFKWKYKE